ncbi:MAG TPA: YIP1 family protein [Gemmatimonadales bacterium]|jgi:hypothetical protein
MSDAAAAATPPAETPVISDLSRMGRVLFSPGAVFGELQHRPTIWGPWIIVSVISMIISWFQRPFQQRVGQIISERAGRPAPPDTMVRAIIGLVLTPVGVLVLVLISALILWALASAMGGDTSFKKMMSVVFFSFPPILIQQAITVAVLMNRGVASITGPADMFVSLGADLALPADAQVGYFTRFFLAGIGPLQIWALVIIAVGVMVMGKTSKASAWTAAIIHFLIILCVLSGLGAFGASMMAGPSR